ncbi:MAG TPA: tetratricopeptide repeat protein, partial [Actinoplanes sp.]|nr:tetratricopeptide repeat protein [Actinoplanes sp.]
MDGAMRSVVMWVTGAVGFGVVLRSCRLAAGLTQEELAARAGLSTRAVSELERGRVARPRPSSVRLLAEALGLEGADLRRFERAGFEPDGPAAEPGLDRGPGGTRVSGPVPAQVPAAVAGFTGRSVELSTLDGLATDPAWPVVAISAVSGTAGVGKSALAVHWAHRVRDRFPDGQLYVNLRGYDPRRPVAPADALAGLLAALGVQGADLPLDADGRAARFRTEIAGRRMLVVLDNASSAEQVRPLLPGTPTCTVVVTSRDSLAGLVAVDGARRVDLDPLPLPDAVTLLRRLVGGRVAAEPAAAETLAEQCGRLPLALRVAAELANTRPRGTLAELVDEFADEQRRLDLLDTGGDPHSAVRAVLSWSYSALPDEAAAAFRLLGLHPAADFDRYAVAALAGVGIPDADRSIDTLVRAHLLHHTGPGRYGLHDLLRAYAADLARTAEAEQVRHAALTRLFDGYLATAAAAADVLFPAERHRRPLIEPAGGCGPAVTTPAAARAWLDAERHTLVALCAYTADSGWPTHATRLSAVLYRYLTGGHHSEAVAIHEAAHRAALAVDDPCAQALALTGLGTVQLLTGRYGPAAGHYRRARKLYRSVRDPGGEASTLTNLGILHARQGRHADAVEHHQQALQQYRRASDAPGQAGALTNIGSADWLRGRHAEAAEGFQRALALFREHGDQAGEARVRSNLGTC